MSLPRRWLPGAQGVGVINRTDRQDMSTAGARLAAS
jgi:hypothetical protein